MEACRQLFMQPGKLWLWSILAAVSLAILIAVASISGGPSAQHAALAIHKAQGDVTVARGAYIGVKPHSPWLTPLSQSAGIARRSPPQSGRANWQERALANPRPGGVLQPQEPFASDLTYPRMQPKGETG